ncbi:ATP-binding protein, partial [Novosphingobium aerophilum]
MLKHPTLDQLNQLGLTGMAHAFADLETNGAAASLSHGEWLALLLDHEATWRSDRRLALRLRHAKLRHHAVPEDVDYRAARGLDRRLFDMLLKGDWIAAHENCAIIGPTGIGKSWLACAIGCQRHCKNPRKWQSKIPHLRFWAVRWLVAGLHFWVGARGGVVR